MASEFAYIPRNNGSMFTKWDRQRHAAKPKKVSSSMSHSKEKFKVTNELQIEKDPRTSHSSLLLRRENKYLGSKEQSLAFKVNQSLEA